MSGVISRISNRIKQAVGKALIESVSDDNEVQLVKISGIDNEVQSNVERVQEYGITSNPPIGSGAVVLYIGGNKDHGVVVKTDSGEFRVQSLKSGEVCIYSKFGQKILLDENGDIVATLETGNSHIVGDGDDFVALAGVIDSYFSIIDTTLGGILQAVDTLAGTTLKATYDAAKTTAFGSTTVPSVASSNSKADQ